MRACEEGIIGCCHWDRKGKCVVICHQDEKDGDGNGNGALLVIVVIWMRKRGKERGEGVLLHWCYGEEEWWAVETLPSCLASLLSCHC